jgi:outer membrane biosynthesis protein TonB
MTGWHRTPTRPARGPIVASIVLHVAVLALVWVVHHLTFEAPEFVAYEITIVSVADPDLPELVDLPDPEELVVETPDPQLPEPEPEPEPEPTPPEPEPEPAPRPEVRPDPDPPVRDSTPPREVPPPASQTPPNTPAESEANVDLAVRMEGLQRDFPVYYARIQAAISTCWRQPPGVERVAVVLRFEIERDGSIRASSIQPFRRSGNGVFDLRAVQAVECAGDNARIPPLPDDIPGDRLPIQFTFTATGFRE